MFTIDGLPSNLLGPPGPLVIFVSIVSVLLLVLLLRPSKRNEPPHLNDTIPYVTNTIQYLTDAGTFLDRVNAKLALTKSNIIKFNVGLTPAYIVTGTKNVQRVFGSPNTLDGNFLQLILMEKHWGMTKEEISKFAKDTSGRQKTPIPGSERIPEDKRYWLQHDRLYQDFLAKPEYTDSLAKSFNHFFTKRLDEQPSGEWATVQLFDVLKMNMGESAIISLFGTKIVDINPEFVESYWKFDDIAGPLVWGMPNFLQRKSIKIRDNLHKMTRNHIDSAWDHFDWNGPDSESIWEPHFGTRLSRETAKWLRQAGFSNQAAAGHTLASLFGLNGNTVPVTTWAMMELIKDPALLKIVREESQKAYEVDPETGKSRINAQKLIALPLLQSIYIEIMRIHVSFNVTRETKQPIEVDGYLIGKGALLQTCSQIAHFEESVWGVEGHPASEFYAWRNIKYVEVVDEASGAKTRQPQFSMKGRPSSFFPYGGGYVMCPGRHFAKQEILLAIAMLVNKFDIEFVEWINSDGSKSERGAQDDRRFAGFVAMAPDRDMKVRWKRLG